MIGSMQDQTLETVDEKLVKTGQFLEGISSDSKKLECLKCFAKCQEVIKWLRDVTNGTYVGKHSSQYVMHLSTCFDKNILSCPDVNDLQNFVNVALATAAGGEDDLAHDKLSNLRTVGSMFGPLIYKLPTNVGYADLAKRWDSLWQTLQNSEDLPEKLVRSLLRVALSFRMHCKISCFFSNLLCRNIATNSWSGTSLSRTLKVQLRSPLLER